MKRNGKKRVIKRSIGLSLLLICILIQGTACGQKEPGEIQKEHIPGKQEAKLLTPTPTPTPTPKALLQETEGEEPTPSTAPTPSPSPVPEPEFFKLFCAMPAGTRIDTEGVSEGDIRACFCSLELNRQIRDGFIGQAGLTGDQVGTLIRVRGLYYQKDGALCICDVVAQREDAPELFDLLYELYLTGQSDGLPAAMPASFAAKGYQQSTLTADNLQYLFIYK